MSASQTAVLRRVRLLRPLRHRDFGLLWAGMSVSVVGDGFYQMALAWQVYELSDAPTAMSIVGAAVTLPVVLFALISGVLTDRFERRWVLMTAHLLRGVAVGAIGLLSVLGYLELWHVVALSAIYGVGESLFGPAFAAIVPDLVPGDELAQANAVDSVVRPLGLHFLGPALGGLLIAAASAGTALLIDSASFGFAIVTLILMQARPRLPDTPHERAAPASALREIAEGLRYVRQHTWLWGTLVGACVSLLFFMGPYRVLLPYVVKNDLAGSASDLGLVFAAGGVGSVLAGLIIGQRGLPQRSVLVMFVAWIAALLGIAGFGFVTAVWQAAAIVAVVQGLTTVGILIWATLVGTLVPKDLIGRVSSLDWTLSIGLVPVSYVATGPVAELIGVDETLVLAGVLGGAIFSVVLFVPGMRAPERAK